METLLQSPVFTIVVGILGILVLLYLFTKGKAIQEANLTVLRKEYDAALQSGDKQKALLSGRRYYADVHPDKADSLLVEQKIANDLSASMN